MPESDYSTTQEKTLMSRRVCAGVVARALGLSFAERDVELIEYLKTLSEWPDPKRLPAPQACADALGVELRYASLVVERVGRFIHKAAMKGDFSQPIRHFSALPEVAALTPRLQKLPHGVTCFIGDSGMDTRHWAADAPFSILAGGHLQSLGLGAYVNKGIGGQKAYQGLERFDADVAAHHPVRVVISFGGNDLNKGIPMEKICEDLGTMVSRSRQLGAKVLLPGLPRVVPERLWWMDKPAPPDAEQRRQRLSAMMKTLAQSSGAQFVDLEILDDADFCTDGIHPNQNGHDRLALKLLEGWA